MDMLAADLALIVRPGCIEGGQFCRGFLQHVSQSVECMNFKTQAQRADLNLCDTAILAIGNTTSIATG